MSEVTLVCSACLVEEQNGLKHPDLGDDENQDHEGEEEDDDNDICKCPKPLFRIPTLLMIKEL
jgi:hypothetical protein